MTDMQRRAIDSDISMARELAGHSSDIKHLQGDMDKMITDMEEVKKTLQEISRTLSEARGGWHVFMIVGGLGATLGGFITWVLDYFKH
tara:strand:- start:65 stop:328 length:264 start_codon:yes stop_codon:yes gene_type:complete